VEPLEPGVVEVAERAQDGVGIRSQDLGRGGPALGTRHPGSECAGLALDVEPTSFGTMYAGVHDVEGFSHAG
jgi:hypothetical protein